MSGICGIIHTDDRPADRDAILGMTAAAAGRGPDGINCFNAAGISLANLALNVTPESVYENQPITDDQQNAVLTGDARIDNRNELIPVLRHLITASSGVITDAHLMLAAYLHWGVDCPAHLVGDFAFAVYDMRERRLFAARDPMGMRTVYYRAETTRFLFATEIQQILQIDGVPRRIFEPALAHYLAGENGHPGWTFYEGIFQLPPGHSVTWDASGLKVERFWDPDPRRSIRYRKEKEYIEHFSDILHEAVRARMRCPGNVGFFLSGGVDSCSAAAVAGHLAQKDRQESAPEIHTFSFAFHRLKQCDEREVSSIIVRHFGFEAHDINAEEAWSLKDYPERSVHPDEPFVGTFDTLMHYTLAEAERHDVRVMFSGHRGDLVTGNDIFPYLDDLRSLRWFRMLRDMRIHSCVTDLPLNVLLEFYLYRPIRSRAASRVPAAVKKMLRRGPTHSQQHVPPWMPAHLARLLKQHPDRKHSADRKWQSISQARRYDSIFLPEHMRTAVWGDRTYGMYRMNHVDPWADRRLAEFALAVPQDLFCRAGTSKWMVREAMRGIMPERALERLSKTLPSDFYLDSVRDLAAPKIDVILSDAEHDYILNEELRTHYEEVRKGRNPGPQFWQAITANMWLKSYWQNR